MGTIICIGQSAWDITAPLDGELTENTKYRILQHYEGAGGPAMNSSYLCACWGMDAYLISRIGEDAYGMKLRDIAEKAGVHTEHLIRQKGYQTPFSFIVTNAERGSRTIFNMPGNVEKVPFTFPEGRVDVILTDGHEPECTEKAIEIHQEAVSVMDAGTCRETTMKAAPLVDYLVTSQAFAEVYTGEKIDPGDPSRWDGILRSLEEIGKGTAVVTLGEYGLIYREGREAVRLPAFPVKAVDATGAGDIFHAAFACGLAEKMPLRDNLIRSSMASALAVQKQGSLASIPERRAVEDALQSFGTGH